MEATQLTPEQLVTPFFEKVPDEVAPEQIEVPYSFDDDINILKHYVWLFRCQLFLLWTFFFLIRLFFPVLSIPSLMVSSVRWRLRRPLFLCVQSAATRTAP